MDRSAGPVLNFEGMLAAQATCRGRWFFRLAYGILRDADAAEDACQQAFLRAWQSRARIQDSVALPAWLAKVVVNESLQRCRRGKTEERALAKCMAAREPNETHPAAGDPGELPRTILCELSEEVRTVVALRLIDGMSGNEVAVLLGCSASEVSRRLHQGMDELRRRLAVGSMGDPSRGRS